MTNEIAELVTDAVSPPAGHYSQATSWRELVFVSGQFGRRQDGSHTFDQPLEAQARQALRAVIDRQKSHVSYLTQLRQDQ